jgi:hypothetical protein
MNVFKIRVRFFRDCTRSLSVVINSFPESVRDQSVRVGGPGRRNVCDASAATRGRSVTKRRRAACRCLYTLRDLHLFSSCDSGSIPATQKHVPLEVDSPAATDAFPKRHVTRPPQSRIKTIKKSENEPNSAFCLSDSEPRSRQHSAVDNTINSLPSQPKPSTTSTTLIKTSTNEIFRVGDIATIAANLRINADI